MSAQAGNFSRARTAKGVGFLSKRLGLLEDAGYVGELCDRFEVGQILNVPGSAARSQTRERHVLTGDGPDAKTIDQGRNGANGNGLAEGFTNVAVVNNAPSASFCDATIESGALSRGRCSRSPSFLLCRAFME